MWFAWLALAIDVPAAGAITPFGAALLVGAALLIMTPGLICCAIEGRT